MPRQGPEHVAEIVSRLVVERGWGRTQEQRRLECAWLEVVGTAYASRTRVGWARHGVIEVVTAEGVVFQELAQFRRAELLEGLRRRLGGRRVRDIRFQLGAVGGAREEGNR